MDAYPIFLWGSSPSKSKWVVSEQQTILNEDLIFILYEFSLKNLARDNLEESVSIILIIKVLFLICLINYENLGTQKMPTKRDFSTLFIQGRDFSTLPWIQLHHLISTVSLFTAFILLWIYSACMSWSEKDGWPQRENKRPQDTN